MSSLGRLIGDDWLRLQHAWKTLIYMMISLIAPACSAHPEGVTGENVADYMVVSASIGCELRYESDYLPIDFQAGLSREQTLAITNYMLSTDQTVPIQGGGV